MFALVTFGQDFVPQLLNNIFMYAFQFLPLHIYAFWYNIVSFSTLVIVKLGSEDNLDSRIAKDCFLNLTLCVIVCCKKSDK